MVPVEDFSLFDLLLLSSFSQFCFMFSECNNTSCPTHLFQNIKPNINSNYLMVPVEDRVVVDEDFSLFDLLLLSSFSQFCFMFSECNNTSCPTHLFQNIKPNINSNYLMVPVEDRVVVDEDFSLFDLLLLSSFSSSETSIKGVSTRLALPVCGVLTTTTLALLTMTSAEDTGLS